MPSMSSCALNGALRAAARLAVSASGMMKHSAMLDQDQDP
jgi:hypothetical protein